MTAIKPKIVTYMKGGIIHIFRCWGPESAAQSYCGLSGRPVTLSQSDDVVKLSTCGSCRAHFDAVSRTAHSRKGA